MNILLAAFVMLLAVVLPLTAIYIRAKHGKTGKAPLVADLCSFFGVLAVLTVVFFTQSASAASTTTATAAAATAAATTAADGMKYIGAALAVGLSGIGGGIAVASSASAALGALSENDSIFGKALIFVGLAEGVALYGLLIAFLIIM